MNLLKPSKITRKFSLILGGLLTSSLLFALPVTAQITEAKVDSLVEALRLAAPDTGIEDDGLYSEWQIKPDNIPRWSRLCIQQELTPAEFEANEARAREVLACVMSDILQEEYEASGNDESLAVLRAAAWWMTGDPEQYNSERISGYTQEVLQYYQQQQ